MKTSLPFCKTFPGVAAIRFGLILICAILIGHLPASAQVPSIQTSVPELTAFLQTDATPCPVQSYVVSSPYCTGDIIITPPAGFEISTNQATWIAAPGTITASQEVSAVPPTTIYVRLKTPTNGTYTGNIVHVSDAVTAYVSVSGIRSTNPPSITTLATDINPSVYGQTVTLTATVAPYSTGTPTGNVTFFDGTTNLGTSPVNGGLTASLGVSNLTLGSHELTATYNGSVVFDPSSSSIVYQEVTKASTSTTVSADHNPSGSGQTVMFTASVAPSGFGSGTPSGTVSISVDGVVHGPIAMTTGAGTYSVSDLAIGPHTVQAGYSGDANFLSSNSSSYADTVDPEITAIAGPHGVITPSGISLAAYGSNPVMKITPNVGYHVDSVIVDSIVQVTDTSFTFTNITANHTIRATFAINRYTITSTAGANGSVSPMPSVTANYGDSVVFTFTPVAGYRVGMITIDGVGHPVSTWLTSYTFPFLSQNHTIDVAFQLNTFIVSASAGVNGTITPVGAVVVQYGTDTTFQFTPDQGYMVDTILVDGIPQPDAPSYTMHNVREEHSISVSFTVQPEYAVRYRSFVYDSLIVAKPVKKAGVSQYWEFAVQNTTGASASEVNLVFKNDAASILPLPGFSISGSGKAWTLTGTLDQGSSVVIKGYSPKAKPQSIAKLWIGAITKTPTAKNVIAAVNISQLPLPNAANVRDDMYKNLLLSKGGMIAGITKSDSAKQYGWVRMKKSADLYKSLYDKAMHTVIGTGFTFVKEKGNLPPSKVNNKLFADLVTLKFNINASIAGITQRGFGELRYVEAGTPYTGMLIRDIATTCDSMLTLASWSQYSGHPALYGSMDLALTHINSAFSGAFDTVSWGSTLRLTGVRRVIDAPIVIPSGLPPTVVAPMASSDFESMPMAAFLHQNYPNPFNPTTNISFELPSAMTVSLKVYNILGQEVATLINQEQLSEGSQTVQFNGSNLASGVYFYRITAAPDVNAGIQGYTSMKKMILIK